VLTAAAVNLNWLAATLFELWLLIRCHTSFVELVTVELQASQFRYQAEPQRQERSRTSGCSTAPLGHGSSNCRPRRDKAPAGASNFLRWRKAIVSLSMMTAPTCGGAVRLSIWSQAAFHTILDASTD
jgi:hypothetical protein